MLEWHVFKVWLKEFVTFASPQPGDTVYVSPNPKQPFSRAEDCEQFCRGDNSKAVFTVIDHITQTLHFSMHNRGFGLIGPRQVHAEYKMHTCKTIYTLIQHGV